MPEVDFWFPLGPPRWQEAPVAYNGLCQCRGSLAPHPFHTGKWQGPRPAPADDYEGKHRKP